MNEIITELSKPVWWISVVIVGIAINLLSSYLKHKLDKTFANMSFWWREKSNARQQAWETRIQNLRSSDMARISLAHSELRFRLQSIYFFLIAIFIMLFQLLVDSSQIVAPQFTKIFVLATSSICFFGSFISFREAAISAQALNASKKTK